MDEYLGSKLTTLTLLSLAESLLIALAVFGPGAWVITMAAGVTLTAVLFCLAGVALIVRYDSINEFLMPSVLYTFLLTAPILGIFGFGPTQWYLPHPVQGPLSLMRIDAAHTTAQLVYAIGYPLLFIVLAYHWSRRALRRLRSA